MATLTSPLPLWERVARTVRCETGEGSRPLVMLLPLIRHGLRPRHLTSELRSSRIPQGEKGRRLRRARSGLRCRRSKRQTDKDTA
jgi:hypothetical protein